MTEMRAEGAPPGRRGGPSHRVLVVEDQELLRRGLRMVLESTGQVTVVGEARDGVEALLMMDECAPDVVLSDAVMPRLDAVGLLCRLRSMGSRVPVLVLTTFETPALVRAAMDAGAAGLLLKDTSPGRILEAIADARMGRLVLDPRITHVALGRHEPAPDELTASERRVAELVADGRSNAAIARELNLAVGTVKNYVSAAMHKLGARDRTQLALRIDRERRPGDYQAPAR